MANTDRLVRQSCLKNMKLEQFALFVCDVSIDCRLKLVLSKIYEYKDPKFLVLSSTPKKTPQKLMLYVHSLQI